MPDSNTESRADRITKLVAIQVGRVANVSRPTASADIIGLSPDDLIALERQLGGRHI